MYRGSRKLVQYGRELGVMCQHRAGVQRVSKLVQYGSELGVLCKLLVSTTAIFTVGRWCGI